MFLSHINFKIEKKDRLVREGFFLYSCYNVSGNRNYPVLWSLHNNKSNYKWIFKKKSTAL